MLQKIRHFVSRFLNSLTMAVLEFIIGLFLMISPSGLAVGIFLVTGILLLADGVVRCIAYFMDPIEDAKMAHKLTTGLFLIVSGIFMLFNYKFVVGVFPAIAALYAILAMLSVFLKTEVTVTLIREKKHVWYIMVCSLVFSFIAMMILFGKQASFVAAGIMLFIAAIIDLVFFLNEKGKIALPTLQDAFSMIASSISRKSEKKTIEPPVHAEPVTPPHEFKPEEATPSAPDSSAAPEASDAPVNPAAPESQGEQEQIDPADEDMSWANVPQIQMPE